MNGNKGQTIFLTFVGIATLIVAVIGATYAYFSTNVNTVGQSSIIITAATIAQVTFQDGTEIRATNIVPGWSATRSITISTTAATTINVPYVITLTPSSNTFVNNEFKLYAGTRPTGGTSSYSTKSAFTATTATTIGNGTLTPTSLTQNWVFTFSFDNLTNTNQNDNQGASFTGMLSVTTPNISQ